jgi:hypothetical protein
MAVHAHVTPAQSKVTANVVRVFEAIKDDKINSIVGDLSIEEADNVFKYVYKALATGKNSGALLKWHAVRPCTQRQQPPHPSPACLTVPSRWCVRAGPAGEERLGQPHARACGPPCVSKLFWAPVNGASIASGPSPSGSWAR